jgi:integrase
MPGTDELALQLSFFDGGPDVARLKLEASRLSSISKAPATERAYACDWADFSGWCGQVGRRSLPCTHSTLELYIVDRLRTLKLSSVERRVAAIVSKHRDAGVPDPYDSGVKAVLAGARRERGVAVDAKTALSLMDLRAICKALPVSRDSKAARDRAIFTVCFAAGMRVSELLALDVADIDFVARKGMALHIGRSKVDQNGVGRMVGVFYAMREYCCPVRSLQRWLKWRGPRPGPLFPGDGLTGRYTREALALMIKRRVKQAGLNPALYGTHSLRAGFVTAASEARVPDALIMQRTGHRSPATLAKYVRPATIFSAGDALARAL